MGGVVDKQRQPDYDFFTPPRPPEPPAGAPAGPRGGFGTSPGQPVASPSSQFGAAPAAFPPSPQFGTAPAAFPPSPQFGAAPAAFPPGTPPAAPGQWTPPATPARKRLRLPSRRTIAIALTAISVTTRLLFHVVPMVRAHSGQAEWESTTVTAPETFDGAPVSGGGYGGTDVYYRLPDGIVGMEAHKADHLMPDSEVDSLVREDRARLAASSTSLADSRPPRGADHLYCATSMPREFVCHLIGNTAMMRVTGPTASRDPAATARQLWSLTVRHG